MDMHEVILGLSGYVSDNTIIQCRKSMVRRKFAEAALQLVGDISAQGLQVSTTDIQTLSRLLQDDQRIAQLQPAMLNTKCRYTFCSPNEMQRDAFSACETPAPRINIHIDGRANKQNIVTWSIQHDIIAVWRSIRLSDIPRVVWVIETKHNPVTTYASFVDMLHSPSEPLVEVFCNYGTLPDYQEMAMLAGELIWSSDEFPQPIMAHEVQQNSYTRIIFQDGNRTLDPVLDHLKKGKMLLFAWGSKSDVITGEQNVVPMSYKTDGRWVWMESTEYYLKKHSIFPPDREFLDYLKEFSTDEVNGLQLYNSNKLISQSLRPARFETFYPS